MPQKKCKEMDGTSKNEEAQALRRHAHLILVVDDNTDAADSTAQFLRMIGYRTCTGYDGAQGIAITEELRPDAILMDVNMPRIDGFQAMRILRSKVWGAPSLLFLIALTACDQAHHRAECIASGCD